MSFRTERQGKAHLGFSITEGEKKMSGLNFFRMDTSSFNREKGKRKKNILSLKKEDCARRRLKGGFK